MCAFCNACFSAAKSDCRDSGIHIGKLSTYRHKSGNNTQYEIWQDSQNKGWISAHCAADAKFKFLIGLLDKQHGSTVK